MTNYAQLADAIANNVAVPLGNVAVSEEFSGDTGYETRKKAVEFLQHAQVLANNMYVLNEVLQQAQGGVSQYQAIPDLLDEATQTKVDSNRDNTGTVWGRAISDERMTTVQTGNRGIFRDKKWIIGATVSDGKITQSHIATAGDPAGKLEPGDFTEKYTILYPLPAQWKSIYDGARNGIGDLTNALRTTVSAMPTIEKVTSGGEYGDMQYTNSIFSSLKGTFQEGDFDENSNFSKLKTNGRTDYQNSLIAGTEEAKRASSPEKPAEETASTTPTLVTTSGGGGGGGGGYIRPASRQTPLNRSRGRGNLRYKLNEVSSDDIFNQLKDKYGANAENGGFTLPNSGTGSRITSNPTLSPYTTGNINPTRPSYTSPHTPSTTSYTSPETTPISPAKYNFSTPKLHSSDLGTTTSSYTSPNYTPSSYTPISGSAPSSNITPVSHRTLGSTIPSGQFNSMMDRLNSPITTRGAAGVAGPSGMPGRNGTLGAGSLSPGGGGSAPMRENASTYRTGESAAGAQRGSISRGNGATGTAGMTRGGMGMMPMMPMNGAGSSGTGGKGNKDNKKSQIKNQDGDLYGNDIKSVAPVISAGNKPAGMPQPRKTSNEEGS